MKTLLALGAATIVVMGGCASKKNAPDSVEPEIVQAPQRPVIGGESYELPRAVVYKVNGDYADRVTIQVDSKGNVVSYPAPTDVKDQEPVALADGWYLSRQGISSRSMFTRWTYREYAALKTVPTVAELKAAIIPDAKITEIRTLPISQAEALADPQKIVL